MSELNKSGVAHFNPTPTPVIRPKTSILDKSLSRGKQEVSLSAFSLLFSEIVQYCQSRSSTVPELQGDFNKQLLKRFEWNCRFHGSCII